MIELNHRWCVLPLLPHLVKIVEIQEVAPSHGNFGYIVSSRQPDDTSDPPNTAKERAEISDSSKNTDPSAKADPWFDSQLMQLYSEVANEPVPEDLLELVKKLRPPTP